MPPFRLLTALAVPTAVLLVLTGCSTATTAAEGAATTTGAETVSYTWDRQTNILDEDAEPTYESTTVEVPRNPDTIVTFEVASLDTIGSLGGQVAGAPLENVPDYLQDYLAEDAFNAGTLFEADLVAIEAQQPDLIVIGGRSSPLYEDLSAIAPTIDLGIRGSYLETLERNTTFLGQVLGAEQEAEAALAQVQTGVAEARELAQASGTGLGLMVAGGELTALAPAPQGARSSQVRGGLIYDVFGVQPAVDDVASATHGEPVSFEFLLQTDPANLWVLDRDAATGEAAAGSAAAVLDNAVVAQTTAARNDDIHYLDPVAWYIVYGGLTTTQVMIDDVKQLAA